MHIRAAIYARVSRPGQAKEDKISIKDQLRACRSFIDKQGWQYAGEFVDPGVTSSTLDRPGLKALFAALDQIDVVVAWDFDRYFRERRSVAGYILDTFDEQKKQITSVNQPIPVYEPETYDPRENDTPYMLREMAGLTSGMDNRRRYRTLQKGIKERFRQGFMTKMPPYGYRIAIEIRDDRVHRLPRQIVPEEAVVVRKIYAKYLEGQSYYAIARGLTADGVLTRNKAYWSANTVRNVIRNPVYCGRVCHSRAKVGGKVRVLSEDQWEVVPGKHPPIIDESNWEKAQALRRRKRLRPRAIGSPSLLSGLVRCGLCGSSMCKDGMSAGGYFSCGMHTRTGRCRRNSYRRLQLEQETTAYVLDLVRNETSFERVASRQQSAHVRDLQAEVDRFQKILDALPARKRRLFDLYENDDITRDEFRERNEEHSRTEVRHRQLLAEKEAELTKAATQKLSREQFHKALKNLERYWESSDLRQRKQCLAALIEKVVIKDGSFKVHLRTEDYGRSTVQKLNVA